MSIAGDGRPRATDTSGLVAFADVERALGLLGEAEALRAEAASLLGRLAATGVAEWLGYVSLERMVAHRTGCRNAAARELVRVARFLDTHPVSAAALRAGELRWAQAESLARAAGGDRAEAFAAYESELLAAARSREPEAFDRLLHALAGPRRHRSRRSRC